MKKIEIDKEKFYDLYINQDLTLQQCADILGGSPMTYSRFAEANGIIKNKSTLAAKRLKTYSEKNNGAKFGWSEESRARRATTNLKRYGSVNPLSNKEVRDRASASYIAKTGYANPGSNPEVIAKGLATKLERYGTSAPQCKKSFILEYHPNLTEDALNILNDKDALTKFISDNGYTKTSEIATALNCSNTTVVHRLNGYQLWDLIDPYTSNGEHEISQFLDELGIKHSKNKSIINPFEIDLYCDDYKIGIEYNGTYWHSSA